MKTKYNKSLVMKRAHKFLNDIPMNERTDGTWSKCLTESWNVEKNGKRTLTFDSVYKEHYNKIVNFINMKINGKREIAEEIADDVFIKVHEHFQKYDVYQAKFTTWLYTITNSKIIDYYRTNKSGLMVGVDGFVNDEGKETFTFIDDSKHVGIEGKEIAESIQRAMSSLNQKEQDIANLYFLQDKQYNEISDLLDIPMGSVKGTISRLRAKLQEKLQSTYASL